MLKILMMGHHKVAQNFYMLLKVISLCGQSFARVVEGIRDLQQNKFEFK